MAHRCDFCFSQSVQKLGGYGNCGRSLPKWEANLGLWPVIMNWSSPFLPGWPSWPGSLVSGEHGWCSLAKSTVMAVLLHSLHPCSSYHRWEHSKAEQKKFQWEQLYSVFNCHPVDHLLSPSVFSGWVVIWKIQDDPGNMLGRLFFLLFCFVQREVINSPPAEFNSVAT